MRRRRRHGSRPLLIALFTSAVLIQLLLPVAYLLMQTSGSTGPPEPVEVTIVDAPVKKPTAPLQQAEPEKSATARPVLPPLTEPREDREDEPRKETKQPVEQKAFNSRLKMVEVTNPESETAAPDARYLSDKNRRVERETRARVTNLVHDRPRPTSKTQRNRAQQPGEKARKVAEQSAHKPARKPREPESGRKRPRSPLLAMRPQNSSAQQAVDRAPPESAEGQASVLRAARPGVSAQGLDLDHRDFDRIYGPAAEKQRRLAREAPSQATGGRVAQRWNRLRAALENFVPEVQPGNQTALGTRANPFALYIARMHRTIHKLWGFGFLDDLDRKADGHPLNDMDLWTAVEIAVSPSGRVAKATIVKPSGRLEFDTAALDTVFSAAPYPPSPRAIRSADGKVYVHWRFHRNQRQCGTFGVDPYILTKPPEGPIDAHVGPIGEQHGARRGSRPSRQLSWLTQPLAHGTQRHPGHRHRHPKSTTSKPRGPQTPEGKPPLARPQGKARQPGKASARANALVDEFLDAFRRADARAMAALCKIPFAAHGRQVAGSRMDLERMFANMLDEAPSRSASRGPLMTPVETRGKLGRLPQGVEYGKDALVTSAQLGDTRVILLLERTEDDARWSVAGLNQ